MDQFMAVVMKQKSLLAIVGFVAAGASSFYAVSSSRWVMAPAPIAFREIPFGSSERDVARFLEGIARGVSLMSISAKYSNLGNFIFPYKDLRAIRGADKDKAIWPPLPSSETDQLMSDRLYLSDLPGLPATVVSGFNFRSNTLCETFTRLAVYGNQDYARDSVLSNIELSVPSDMKRVFEQRTPKGGDVLLKYERGRLAVEIEYWESEKIVEERRVDRLCELKETLKSKARAIFFQ